MHGCRDDDLMLTLLFVTVTLPICQAGLHRRGAPAACSPDPAIPQAATSASETYSGCAGDEARSISQY